MSEYTTNFPPQTYSSSFYINSLVDDEKSTLVAKTEISSADEARNAPLLDCFISTMSLLHQIQLYLWVFVHFRPTLESRLCFLSQSTKTVTFSSLLQYQGTRSSFNPDHPTYQGNVVDFNFETLDRLSKNSFISFDSNSIVKITLNRKRITTIEDGAFIGLFCLHYLELRHNHISNLTEDMFQGLDNLQELDLSENFLESVPGLAFRHLGNLIVLNLSRNRIRTVNALAFFNLTNLELLNLSSNRIRHIAPTMFSALHSLKELHLNKNYLGDIEPEHWTGLHNLEFLNLAQNYLDKFDPSYNFSFAGLRKLNLSGNSLTSLNVFNMRKYLVKLEAIDITDNNWLCEDLEVVTHQLVDSRIAQSSPANCSASGEYKPRTTERNLPSTSAPTETTRVTKRLKDYSRELYVQTGEISYGNKKIMENVQHVQVILVYLLVIVVVFVLIDMSVRIGLCRFVYYRMTGRNGGYLDGDDIENMVLMRR